MEKKYLVTGNWIDKRTGNPVSGMVAVTKGKNKEGHAYEIADTDSRETIDGTYPVGTILSASISITLDDAPTASKPPSPQPQPRSTKP